MKKIGEIAIVVLIIVIMISGGLTFVFLGTRADNTHYVCIEVNPRVEFLTNSKKKVESVKPLNDEAHTLLIDEQFEGMDIVEAAQKFVDLCTQAGYIDVNGKDNAVRISVLSGLNQSLEVNINRAVSGYLVKNEIFGVVLDGTKDLQQFKQAKKEGVSSEKYDLMLAVKENDDSQDFKQLKKKNNKQLLDIIKKQHEDYVFDYTQEQLENKVKLIDFNRTNYNAHKQGITKATTKQFREEYAKYLKKESGKYEQNFDKTYDIWAQNE